MRRPVSAIARVGIAGLMATMLLGVTPASATEPAPETNVVEESPGGSVIGGSPTTLEEHRYAANIRVTINRTTFRICTGSVVDRQWILTAAHCVDDGRPVNVFLYGGSARSTATLIHPLWNGEAFDGHDLALLEVPRSATQSTSSIQIGDPFRSSTYAARNHAQFVGIGETERQGPGTLHDVTMRIQSDGAMESIYEDWWRPDRDVFRGDLMIGAGSRTKGICSGDSGGPLTTFVFGHRVQIGVASFGAATCDRPGVYGELDNANLAWLATSVPSIVARWPDCIAGGRSGSPVVSYVRSTDGPFRDGPYSWDLRCVADSPPPPTEPPQEPPICLKKPWLCEPER